MKINRLSSRFPALKSFRRFVWIALIFLGGGCEAQANVITSPDGNVVVTVSATTGNLAYSVNYRGVNVVETSPLGVTVNNTNVGTAVAIGNSFTYATNETFASRSGIHATATNWYQGQIITVTHIASGISYNLDVRAFNNGVAFRYEFADAAAKNITAELSGFVIPSNSTIWFQTATSTYETYYRSTNINSLAVSSILGPPATIQLSGTNGFLALTESTPGVFGSPYLTKVGGITGRQLQVTYPVNQDGKTGTSVTGEVNTPWNVIMIGADLNMIINNDCVESLAPSPNPLLFPQGTATSWTTTGRSVWDWLQPQSGGITYTNAMTNSLWASRLGFEYNTVDAGWSSWNGGNPWPQVQQVINYSHALGIKVLLWKSSSELNTALQRSAFFQQLQTYGVDGFKADFFDFSSVSAAAKERVQLRQAILQDAAVYHLVANFHGTTKPSGEFRTYPNLIENEGIFGKEQYPNPWMVVSDPLERFLAGPADYTPLDFGGNIAFEIANVVNMPGPLITYCERSDLIANSAYASLIRTIPSQWDQTIVLGQTQLGQTTATARRKGQDWYIGIMNANVTNFWNIPLTFLAPGVTYRADIVRQDSSTLENMNVTQASLLSVGITTTNGSGFVAKIYQVPAFTVSPSYQLTGAVVGTSGSWSGSGNTRDKAFDGNLASFFDGPDVSGDWVGLDLGGGNQNILRLIRYCPRATYATRMMGGVFQGANAADFSGAVTLYTVGYTPPDGMFTTVAITNNTPYRYVRYLSPLNGWCNVAELQFYGGTNSPAPVGLNAASGLNQVVLGWNASSNVVYNVMRSTNSGGPYAVITTNLSTSAFTDTNLTSGQMYYYVVSAMSAVGLVSPNSTEVSSMPGGPPAVPTILSAMPGTNQTFTLTWNATLNTSDYLVERSIVSGGPYFVVASPSTTSFTDSGLANGVTYYYVVSAVNTQGRSPNSTEVSATPGEYGAWVLGLNPVGYWQLNNASGATAFDASGNGLDGTYQPAVTLGVPCVAIPPYFGFASRDLAASFNGQNNSWVSLPALNLNSAAVTLTAWIYPTTITQPGATGLIFCRDGLGTVSGFGYNPAGTQLGYTWNNDSGTYGWNSGLTPPANQWSFVALVVTPANAIIYLYNTNGQSSASLTHTQAVSSFSGETRIGNDSFDVSRTFNGSLSDVAIYNRSLSADQIASLYQGAVGQFYNPTLASTWDGAQLTLAWPGNDWLLQATNLTGPWITNFGVSSPRVVVPTEPREFYRIHINQ